MIDALVSAVLVIGVATLAIAFYSLRSSRRSEGLGEERYELLRDQHERLEVMSEERRTLISELERESQERQRLMEVLEQARPHLVEDLEREQQEKRAAQSTIRQQDQERLRLEQELRRLEEELQRERQRHLEAHGRAEQLEQEQNELRGIRQEVERLVQERQQLTEDLKKEREDHLEAQRRIEQQEQARVGLQRELERLREERNSRGQVPTGDRAEIAEAHPSWWRRRPGLVVILLFGVLVAWFTSLAVALNLLSS
jgi:chromosome segregation ATPase